MPEYKPPTVKEVFHKAWQNFLGIVGETLAATAAEHPAVAEKIEEAKTKEAKNILWRFFPIAIVAVIVIFLIRSLR